MEKRQQKVSLTHLTFVVEHVLLISAEVLRQTQQVNL